MKMCAEAQACLSKLSFLFLGRLEGKTFQRVPVGQWQSPKGEWSKGQKVNSGSGALLQVE